MQIKRDKFQKLLNTFLLALAITLVTACEPKKETMPIEYQRIKEVVNRLAASNGFGNDQILFSVVSGRYASFLAEELGLCKQDEYGCIFFSQLNPFTKYDDNINEILRQAYIFGDVNGYAHSNGTIELPRHVFRLVGSDNTKLACIIAHEITHVVEHHTFKQSKELSEISEGVADEEEKKIMNAKLSRKYEKIADKNALKLTARAGYPAQSCIDFMTFLYESSGDGEKTQKDSTHPDLDERISALRKSNFTELSSSKADAKALSKPVWSYSRKENYLILQPGEQ